MSPRARRLLPLLIGLALILPAVVPAPAAASASDAEAMILKKMNYERTKRGLVALRLDTRLAAIARDRSEYQARTGDADHTQGSKNVFDFIQAAGIKWYAAGEIIAQNRYYPSVAGLGRSGHQGLARLVDPPLDPALEGLQLRRLRLRDEPRQSAPLLDGRLHEGPRPHGARGPDRRRLEVASSGGYIAVKIRWSGADRRLQVLTSGLRYFQIQRRAGAARGSRLTDTTSDVQDGPLVPGQGQGGPRPIQGQGRQLEQVGYAQVSL